MSHRESSDVNTLEMNREKPYIITYIKNDFQLLLFFFCEKFMEMLAENPATNRMYLHVCNIIKSNCLVERFFSAFVTY